MMNKMKNYNLWMNPKMNQDLQAGIGCLQYPCQIGTPRPSRVGSPISRGKEKKLKVDTCTGRCWWCGSVPSECECASLPSFQQPTVNYQEVQPQIYMCGKTTPPLPEPVLNWERNLTNETQNLIGRPYGNGPSMATYWPLKQTCVYNIIAHSEQYALTTSANESQGCGLATFGGQARVWHRTLGGTKGVAWPPLHSYKSQTCNHFTNDLPKHTKQEGYLLFQCHRL